MNILVTLDANYLEPLCHLLRSLQKTHPNRELHVYVAHASLTAEHFQKIQDAVGAQNKVFNICVSEDMLKDAPVLKRITKSTYYRLFAAAYLPKDVDRVLYIDPDTVVLRDLSALYDLDFGDNLYAGCSHVGWFRNFLNTTRLKMTRKTPYVNAGILMINLSELRKEFSAEEIFRYIEKNASKLLLADQDVLNALYFDRMLVLDEFLYNCDESSFKRLCDRYGEEQALDFVCTKTCIIHYNGKFKPWRTTPVYKGELNRFYPDGLDSKNA